MAANTGCLVVFERSLDSGALFEIMAVELRASSAQLGMADVIAPCAAWTFIASSRWRPSRRPARPSQPPSPGERAFISSRAATLCGGISEAREIDTIVDVVLDGLRDSFGCANSVLLVKYPAGERLGDRRQSRLFVDRHRLGSDDWAKRSSERLPPSAAAFVSAT